MAVDTGNEVGSVVDMADMRNVTARVGAALVLAAAGVAATSVVASADPAPGHQVTYTLATGGTYDFTITYLTAQRPAKTLQRRLQPVHEARDHYGVPPGRAVGVPNHPRRPAVGIPAGGEHYAWRTGAPPNAHCEVSIDGQVDVAQDAPYSPQCYLSKWTS